MNRETLSNLQQFGKLLLIRIISKWLRAHRDVPSWGELQFFIGLLLHGHFRTSKFVERSVWFIQQSCGCAPCSVVGAILPAGLRGLLYSVACVVGPVPAY